MNRLVTQNVLVGHYRPIEGYEDKGRRTLIVLPLDDSEIRGIEVSVLTEEANVYGDITSVRNVTSDYEAINGLYVEFANLKRPQRFTFCEDDLGKKLMERFAVRTFYREIDRC